MRRITQTILIVFLVGVLMLIRGFEEVLFYDPLTAFFKSVYSYEGLPEFETPKLLVNVVLRFLLNTLVSLGILWVLFQNKDFIKLSVLLYSVTFVFFFGVFYYLLVSKSGVIRSDAIASETENYLWLFYIRRFLIHPIVLLVLIPAFYFQKKKE